MIQQNPRLADSAIQDPRMIQVIGVLLGIDMQGFSRPEGSDELPPGFSAAPGSSSSATPASWTSDRPSSSKSRAPEPQDVKMAEAEVVEEEEEDEDAKLKKEAEAEKKKGSDAYRARNLEAAEAAFSKAWDLWPKDITFLTNLSGMLIVCTYSTVCPNTTNSRLFRARTIRQVYRDV